MVEPIFSSRLGIIGNMKLQPISPGKPTLSISILVLDAIFSVSLLADQMTAGKHALIFLAKTYRTRLIYYNVTAKYG